jgi:hypothetical protein
MKIPDELRRLLLAGGEPGATYRQCLEWIAANAVEADYGLTETVVYATEVRYALDVIRTGRIERLWNFGDLQGGADQRLWRILDEITPLKVAFVGSGPYPVTALLLHQRYPQASITCIDNNITAHFLSEAVIQRLEVPIETCFAEATEVDYSPFTVVVAAAMVSGKKQFVQKLLAESECLVILRGWVDLQHPRLISMSSTFRDDGSLG